MSVLNTQSLKAYIETRGVAFQPINCLLEAGDEETSLYKDFISSQVLDDKWKVLTKRQAFEKGFEELAEWALDSDYIISIELEKPINGELVIAVCFPKKEFESIEY